VGLNPTTHRLYALLSGSAEGLVPIATQLRVLDPDTFSVLASVTFPDYWAGLGGIWVNASTNRIYVCCAQGAMPVIDGASNTLVATVSVGTPNENGIQGPAIDPLLNRVYAALYSVDRSGQQVPVVAVDGTTNQVVGRSPSFAEGAPRVAINPTTNRLYLVQVSPGNLIVLEEDTATPTPVVPEPSPLWLFGSGLLSLRWLVRWSRGRTRDYRDAATVIGIVTDSEGAGPCTTRRNSPTRGTPNSSGTEIASLGARARRLGGQLGGICGTMPDQ
jgi:hypothetical protein